MGELKDLLEFFALFGLMAVGVWLLSGFACGDIPAFAARSRRAAEEKKAAQKRASVRPVQRPRPREDWRPVDSPAVREFERVARCGLTSRAVRRRE